MAPRIPRLVLAEEIANAVTHGAGALLSAMALALMLETVVAGREGLWHVLSVLVYGLSLILLYLASTLYHSFFHLPKVKAVFQILDHSAIYLLIAGSYTPFLWIALRKSSGMYMSAVVWSLALVGIIWQCCAIGKYRILSTLCYVGMGWLSVVLIPDLLRALPEEALFWLAAGGVSYTAGAVFYLMKKLPFHHAVWHLFVLAGSAAHFYCIYQFVLPLSEL